jgi:hypothetical protein
MTHTCMIIYIYIYIYIYIIYIYIHTYTQFFVKQTRDCTVHVAISTCRVHPLFRGRVKKEEKNFVNIWQDVEQGSIQREHGLMGAASSNAAGISERGKDIRHKTAMSESWTVFSMVCIM